VSVTVSSSNRFPELEKYELLEEIGHGGMATVYRGLDLRLDREVAVKIIHKHLRENAEVRRRFVAEAKAVAKLRHRGIVEVYDVSEEADAERYLVVELIRGVSLRELLVERGALPAEVAATMVSVLCDAVEHAHETGIIHRDIKPENVLIELPDAAPDTEPNSVSPDSDDDGDRRVSDIAGSSARSGRGNVVIKLTDFGIAKLLDAHGVTSTGQILGSPAHMAPEQIEGGEIGTYTDVFALGVLLYECMVGHLPFEGTNPAQVLRRVLQGSFEPPDTERPEIGGRWARIIAAALTVSAEDRIQGAAELGTLIDAELDALGIEDPRRAMVDFFVHEAAYERWIRDELVPRLLVRGEKERKAGRIPGAAADFNRALALNPDDLSILKRVSSLSSETMWKQRISKSGGIIALAAALFGATFGVTKWLSSSVDIAPTPVATITPEVSAAPSASAAPEASTAPDPSAAPSTEKSAKMAVVPGPKTTASADPVSDVTERKVSFNVIPKGAKLVVDGRHTDHFGATSLLNVGPHSFRAFAAGSCCKPREGRFSVPPPKEGDEDKLFHVTIRLEIKPATVALTGAKAGETVTCKGVMAPGGISLSRPQEQVNCQFSNGTSRSVKLKAGEQVVLQWPR
jgi:serine/threonine protein kinase